MSEAADNTNDTDDATESVDTVDTFDANGTDDTRAVSASAAERASFLEVLRFTWSYWRRVPYRFAGMIVGTTLGVLLEVQIPRLSADLVVTIEQLLRGAASSELAWQAAWSLIGMFAAVFVVKQLYMRNWMYLASQIMQELLMDGFLRVQRFSLDWHANHFAGSTQRKITRGQWAYDSLADTLIIDLGPGIGLLLGFTVAMTLRDPWLGLYFGVTVALFLATSIALSLIYVAPANRLSIDADTEVGGRLADTITCNGVVRSFGAEDREDARFDDASQSWRLLSRRSWLRSMDAGAVQSFMLLLLLTGLLSLVLFRPGDASGRVEGAVYVIATYLVVHSYLRNIGWQVRNLQRAVNELDDLVAISKTEPQVRDLPGAPAFVPGPGEIRIEGVDFGYKNQPDAIFQGLSVEIRAGEKLALVGESGSGKSTFAKLLQRLYDVDAGRILIDGQDVSRVTQASLRQAISVVPQEPILFHRSLAENISYAKPGATREELVTAAKQAHANEFIEKLEEGYETLVGERGIKLSGGERQRVAIARAILADAPILVLDEATSSLDSITEHLIQQALRSLIADRTAVVIAHRLSTVRGVDRILVFDNGRIVEEGSHQTLMLRPDGRYRALVEMQTFDDSTPEASPEASLEASPEASPEAKDDDTPIEQLGTGTEGAA